MRQKYNLCCVWSWRHCKSIQTFSSFFMWKTNMAVKLSFVELTWLLKCYWKVENVVVSSTTLEGWIWYTTNKGNTNKKQRQIWSRWDGARCFERSLRKRKCYGVPTSISRFNPSRLLPLGSFKEHGVRRKTIGLNTGGTEKSDWTCHQWYSISNNPDGMSLCWECTVAEGGHFEHVRALGSWRNRTQHKL